MSEKKAEQSATPLAPGTRAPDFKLKTTPDQSVSLSDFRGAPVILAFYPADWSPVCGDQMALYNQVLPEFRRFNAEPLGISVDGVWCHSAFARDRNLHFPLLADFEPKGSVAQTYGVYRPQDGTCERALFVIDPEGTTVFYPGGHGPLWDLSEDKDSIQLIEVMFGAGKPVAAVCHAPGVVRHARAPMGPPSSAASR